MIDRGMGELTGVDKERRRVFVSSLDRQDVPVDYDYLVVATGVRHSYFGHKEFERFAPGLKTLADAVPNPIFWAGPIHGRTYELQRTADGSGLAPAGWRPGEPLLAPPPQDLAEALEATPGEAWFCRTREDR